MHFFAGSTRQQQPSSPPQPSSRQQPWPPQPTLLQSSFPPQPTLLQPSFQPALLQSSFPPQSPLLSHSSSSRRCAVDNPAALVDRKLGDAVGGFSMPSEEAIETMGSRIDAKRVQGSREASPHSAVTTPTISTDITPPSSGKAQPHAAKQLTAIQKTTTAVVVPPKSKSQQARDVRAAADPQIPIWQQPRSTQPFGKRPPRKKPSAATRQSILDRYNAKNGLSPDSQPRGSVSRGVSLSPSERALRGGLTSFLFCSTSRPFF